MKKLLLALLLAVSITHIASVSAASTYVIDKPTDQGGNGQTPPEGNGQGGETTPPTQPETPKPDPAPKPEQPQPEQPQKPTPTVSYNIVEGYQKAIILKQSEVATTDLVKVLGVEGKKVVQGQDPVPATVTASPVSADKMLQAQEITLSVGEGDAVTTATATVTVVPDTYTVNDSKGLAIVADKALTLTQTEAKALNGNVNQLPAKLNANGINAEGTKIDVFALEDENLNKVITGTPGTWNVQLSAKKPGPVTFAAQDANTFTITAAITVTDENQAALPQADATGSIRPEEAATQADYATTAAGVTGAAVPGGVRTGASTNVVTLVTTVLVAASLIFVVKRTRK